MPTTRSNPNAIKLPADISMPHPDLQEDDSKATRRFDENSSDTDTDNYTMSMGDATGLSIFSDFLHGRLEGKERDWGSSNLDTTLSGDSSFAFSWGGAESEFEQNATRKALQLYENVQCVLYQNSSNLLQENMNNECNIWREYFLHLRLVGHQVFPSSDDFVQMFERERSTPKNFEIVPTNKNDLQLIGTPVCCHGSQSSDEILYQIGVYEEFFAFDSTPSSPGDDKNNKCVKKRSKLPPVSPSSCIKEAILETVFEQLWEELTPLMEPLVEFCKSNRDSQFIASIQSSRTSSGIRPQIPSLQNAFPPLPPVFPDHIKYESILPQPISNINNFQKPNPLQAAPSVLQQADYTALRNAIQIRPFPLQSRGSVTTNQPPDLPPDPRNDLQYILSPPTTAGTGYNSVKPFQYQQAKPFQRSSDSSTGVLTQHRPRTQGRKGQLRPLGTDNSKNNSNVVGSILGNEVQNFSNHQAGQLEGVLFGHKMTLDRLATPGSQTRSPVPWSKPYKQLPPIEIEEYRFSPSPIRQQRTTKVSFSSRVSSAGLDSAKERKLSQTSKIGNDNRPQTIHTLRSDIQQEISAPLNTALDIYQKISTPLSPISLRGAAIRGNNAKLSNHAKFAVNKQFNISNLENNGILSSISGIFPEENVGKQTIGFGKLAAERSKLKTVTSIRGISL